MPEVGGDLREFWGCRSAQPQPIAGIPLGWSSMGSEGRVGEATEASEALRWMGLVVEWWRARGKLGEGLAEIQ